MVYESAVRSLWYRDAGYRAYTVQHNEVVRALLTRKEIGAHNGDSASQPVAASRSSKFFLVGGLG